MSDLGKKLVRAAKEAQAKIRECMECRHEWMPLWITGMYAAKKCNKCGTVRVQRKGDP